MLKKLEKAGGQEEKKIDWDGKEGERKLEQITLELRQYYKENKDFKKGGTSPHKLVNVSDDEFGSQQFTSRLENNNGSPEITDEEINHVQRNAMLMSKFRQMSDIKMQMNQDVMYARLYNSQQKAAMLDNEKRLRSVQWLTKWDEFRKEKSVWIDRVLAILK